MISVVPSCMLKIVRMLETGIPTVVATHAMRLELVVHRRAHSTLWRLLCFYTGEQRPHTPSHTASMVFVLEPARCDPSIISTRRVPSGYRLQNRDDSNEYSSVRRFRVRSRWKTRLVAS